MKQLILFLLFNLIVNIVFTQKTFQYKDYDFCTVDALALHSTDSLIYYANYSFDERHGTLLSAIDSSGEIQRLVVDSTLVALRSKIFEVGKDSLIFFYYYVFEAYTPLFVTFEVTFYDGVFSSTSKYFDPDIFVFDIDLDVESFDYTILDEIGNRILKYDPSGMLVKEVPLPNVDSSFQLIRVDAHLMVHDHYNFYLLNDNLEPTLIYTSPVRVIPNMTQNSNLLLLSKHSLSSLSIPSGSSNYILDYDFYSGLEVLPYHDKYILKGKSGSKVFIVELDSNGQILDTLLHEATNGREDFEYFLYDDFITSTHQNANNSDGYNTIITQIDLRDPTDFECVDLKFIDVEMFNISKELIEEDTIWNGQYNKYKWNFVIDFIIENEGSEYIDSFNIIPSFFSSDVCPTFKFYNIQSNEIKTYQTNLSFTGLTNWVPEFNYFQLMGGNHRLQCQFESISTELTLSNEEPFSSIDNHISIYPNPTSDILVVDFPILKSDGVVSIYSIDGKLVLTQNIEKDDTIIKLDLSKFIQGLYFVALRTKEHTYDFKKFVKNI